MKSALLVVGGLALCVVAATSTNGAGGLWAVPGVFLVLGAWDRLRRRQKQDRRPGNIFDQERM